MTIHITMENAIPHSIGVYFLDQKKEVRPPTELVYFNVPSWRNRLKSLSTFESYILIFKTLDAFMVFVNLEK